MDWRSEANALIDDIKNHVRSIQVSNHLSSDDMEIFFDIETLEQTRLIISMGSSGFKVCSASRLDTGDDTNLTSLSNGKHDIENSHSEKIYETIYALLDDNSPMYRRSFATALISKISSI